MRKVDLDSYTVHPEEIGDKLKFLYERGKELDNDVDTNVEGIKVIGTNMHHGRLILEVEFPDGGIVLFYRSRYGTSGKMQGTYYPIGGFIDRNHGYLPEGWLIKNSDVHFYYHSEVFEKICKYLKENGETFWNK